MGIAEGFEGNWKTVLKPRLGDKWDKWKTTRQHMKKPWRQLRHNIWAAHIWETTGSMCLGERWKTMRQQQEWETTSRKLAISWRQLAEQIWEASGRQLSNNRSGTFGKPHLLRDGRKTTEQQPDREPTPGKPHLGDNWETACGREVEDN